MTQNLLDAKDLLILKALDRNARTPITQIAKQTSLQKSNVIYRIKRLEKNGVIEGYYPIINSHALGKLYIRLWFKLDSSDQNVEQDLIRQLKANPKISWVGILEGRWDLVAVFICDNIKEYDDMKKDLLSIYGIYVVETSDSIAMKVSQFPANYLLNTGINEAKTMQPRNKMVSLDDKDLLLLSILKSDCTQSLVKLGAKLACSANAAKHRLQVLERSGVILGYAAQLDYALLGFTYFKVFFKYKTHDYREKERFERNIESSRPVLYTVQATGENDFEIEVLFKQHSEFFLFMKELRSRYSKLIGEYSYYVVHEVPKIEY